MKAKTQTVIGRRGLVLLSAVSTIGLFAASNAQGASTSWIGATSDAWATGSNWANGTAPGNNNGAVNNATSSDTATFSGAINGGFGSSTDPIVIDLNRLIKGITFNTGADSYHIGVPSGNTLVLTSQGAITMNAGVANPQFITGPVQVRSGSSTNGIYSFVNNSTTPMATLNFTNPTFTLTNANGRPTTLTLDGSNTGLNVISSNITDGWTSAQGVGFIVKNGTGTWELSGANQQTGTATNVNAGTGTFVNNGTLILANSQALSATSGTAQVTVGSGTTGTLQLTDNATTGAITLNSTVQVNLAASGTLQSNGSEGIAGKLNVASTAVSPTISTVNSGDIFTLGGAVGGGSSSTVLNVSGPGQIVVNAAGTYIGNWSFNSGTTTIGNGSALGTSSGVTFGASSTSKLQINSQNVTIGSLASTDSSGIVENGGGANATLTVNGSTSTTFSATLRDGTGGGNLGLVRSGSGTLTLTGNNSYTGGTTINGGTLSLTNTSGSATGSGDVNVNSLGTLAGTGIATGNVIVNSGGAITPGVAGTGTLTVGTLTLASGSNLKYDINSTSDHDQINVSNTDGLSINGGQVTLTVNGGLSPFTTNGVYNLIGYIGSITGDVNSLVLNPNNENTSTSTYSFGAASGYVTLTVASSGVQVAYWNVDGDGNWSSNSNWTTNAAPNAVGAFAAFGGSGAAITANRIVSVDGNFTAGTLSFNNQNFSYTLAAAGGSITLDNGGSASFLTDAAGSHVIAAPVALTSNGVTATVSNSGDSLSVSGQISGPGGISKIGAGTLALTGNNSYTGGTTLSVGTIQINSGTSLGDPSGNLIFDGGNLQLVGDVNTTRNYLLSNLNSAVIDTNGHSMTQAGTITQSGSSTGHLIKNGAGMLTLGGANTYADTTIVNAGGISVSSNANLGNVTLGAGLSLADGTTFQSTATMALNNGTGVNSRAVTIAIGGSATFDVANATTLAIDGLVSGGSIIKTSTGTLNLTNNTNTPASITLAAGTLNSGDAGASHGALGTGAITMMGGTTLSSSASASSTWTMTNPLVVDASATSANPATINSPIKMTPEGPVSGSGTLNWIVNTNVSRMDFANNFAAFTGNLNLSSPVGGTSAVTARIGINPFSGETSFNAAGWASTNMDIEGLLYLVPSDNSGGNNIQIGALTSASEGSGLRGSSAGGSPNWQIGALNTNTTYEGFIDGNSSLTKVGTGTLTLSNISNFNLWTGNTTVTAGTLHIGAAGALSNQTNLVVNGGTLDLDAYSSSVQGTTMASGTITGAAGTVLTSNSYIMQSGLAAVILAGGGGLNKTGTGTATLTAANTYTGGTTISAGTLVAGDGNLGDPSNAIVLDGGTLQAPVVFDTQRTLTVNATGGQLNASGTSMTIEGTANTTLNGNLTVAAGTVTFNRSGGTVTVAPTSAVTIAAGATANFNGATTIFTDGTNYAALAVNGTANLGGDRAIGNLSGASTGVLNTNGYALTINQSGNSTYTGSLNASASAVTKNLTGALTLKNVRANSLTVNAGTVAIAPTIVGGTAVEVKGDNAGTSVLNSLTLAPGATMDLGNHSLIVNYAGTSPASSIRSAIANAYNAGAWNQPGLTSTVAAADTNRNTSLGYAEASDLGLANGGTFAGQTVSGQAVLVKYTYYGDQNLDGVVNLDDFSIFVDGINGLGSGWVYGDFNYDGQVDQTDFAMFVKGYNLNPANNPPLSQLILSDSELSVSQKAALLSVVPEPTSLGILAFGAGAMAMRRRRKV